ncbi:MAG: BamA/TamA family outer membrane protein [Desulfobacteraceae bacterium]|nr:BamA/TamA family outer membrane protein [Desulfobacteraceae bacterium]MBC2756836.1 BamA/TamA family outer membrane protein [Desulfobacteraceae bacterium]
MIKPQQLFRFLVIQTIIMMIGLTVTSLANSGQNTKAPSITKDVMDDEDKKLTPLILPYAFYTESFEFIVGVGGGATGFQDGQAGVYGTVFTTTNSTTGAFLLGTDTRVPLGRRLFVDSIITYGWYAEVRDYISGNPDFPDEEAGSNDSSPENYVTSSGYDSWAEFNFKYILPWGNAGSSGISTYKLDHGLLVSGATGGEFWNPLKSGISFIEFQPFYRYRTFEFPTDVSSGSTNGFEFGFVHDNRDYPQNPSTGSIQRLNVTSDFGWFGSESWTVIKGGASKYISLGETEKFRQRVIALNLWVSDNISEEVQYTDEGERHLHRAPAYLGSSLGGFYQLRGYPQYRFSDKVAIYYGAEFRLIPDWNPLGRISVLKFFDIDWIQLVGILEAGRVDSHLSADSFYKDLHWDIGLGIRIMARKVVLRIDGAASDEGFSMWAMAGQAF